MGACLGEADFEQYCATASGAMLIYMYTVEICELDNMRIYCKEVRLNKTVKKKRPRPLIKATASKKCGNTVAIDGTENPKIKHTRLSMSEALSFMGTLESVLQLNYMDDVDPHISSDNLGY